MAAGMMLPSPTIVPLAGLAAAGLLYHEGSVTLHRRAPTWPMRRRIETWCFATGLGAATAALAPPLDRRADASFAAHMVQHLLLAVVAAPLLALGGPGRRIAAALPCQARLAWSGWRRRHRRLRAAMIHPATGWVAFLAAWWAWHLPAMYDAALRHPAVHAAEHASLLAAGYLFAAGLVVAVRRRQAYGVAVVSLATTSLHSGALGALLLFSARPLSDVYAGRRGAGALKDQQLAGIWMWVIAGPVFVAVAVALLAAALRHAERTGTGFEIAAPDRTGDAAVTRARRTEATHA